MKKITLEDFIQQPKDSNILVTLNNEDLFIFIQDSKEILELINPKKPQKEQQCTEK